MRPQATPPEVKLDEMIARHMARPGCVTQHNAESEFIMSGLRAAMSANSASRGEILKQVSSVISCKADDLEFLLSDFEDSAPKTPTYDVMIPDFQSVLLDVAE